MFERQSFLGGEPACDEFLSVMIAIFYCATLTMSRKLILINAHLTTGRHGPSQFFLNPFGFLDPFEYSGIF